MATGIEAEARHELTITRRFAAPVPLVFRIWEDTERRRRWWGPKDFTCTAFEQDFRPGGVWRACIVSDAYGENWMSGVFREIERDRRLVFTFAWQDGEQPGHETLVTVTWEADGDGTLQRFHQAPFLTEASRDSHLGGWTSLMDRQQAYLEEIAR